MADRLAPLDLLDLDSLHSAEERDVRAVVRRLVDDRVRPHVADWYERGQVPVRDLVKEFASSRSVQPLSGSA